MNRFDERIGDEIPGGLHCDDLSILQVNLGRLCNLACKHCHLECSPDRKELMEWSTMEKVASIAGLDNFRLIDITGGEPEMHPHFRKFIELLSKAGKIIQVRTNLSFLAEPGKEMTDFLKGHRVQLVGSLPCYLEENVDGQRGKGTYSKDIEALKQLNEAGYGIQDDLQLNLVYNPGGPFLPGTQQELESAYKKELKERFGILFTKLLVITNIPIGRFRHSLERSGELDTYEKILDEAYNPSTLPGLMCRHQVCVDWDGQLYDCDFNLALQMQANHGAPSSIDDFDINSLIKRRVVTGEHCFACTAGSGSSCGGSLT